MEPYGGWWRFAEPGPKALLLALKRRQSVPQQAAVVSRDSHDCSDLTFDGLELRPISPKLLLAFVRCAISFLLKGSGELAHKLGCHQPLLETFEHARFDFLPAHRRVVITGAFAAP